MILFFTLAACSLALVAEIIAFVFIAIHDEHRRRRRRIIRRLNQ